MRFNRTDVRILHQKTDLGSIARTGISMHCHTQHSKEMLDFVPHYASKLPVISHFWQKESIRFQEENGAPLNFAGSWWSPPLDPPKVFEAECRQIEESGLAAIVSITDHDSIDGAREARHSGADKAPLSMEWTVPYKHGFFHVGVHGLPEERADEIEAELLAYTFAEGEPDGDRLAELFRMLNEIDEVLIVLNHPIWDIELIGQVEHEMLLSLFLTEHGDQIHALEINGFRSWSENKAVLALAREYDLPVVSGGDRHGCQPNTVINISRSNSFAEFVDEVRTDKHSEVVVMPEYKQPLHSRQLQSFSEILDTHLTLSEDRVRWFDRVFFDLGDGRGAITLADHGWKRGGPTWLRAAIWTLGFLGSPAVRPVFGAVLKRQDRVDRDIREAVAVKLDVGLQPKLSSKAV